MAIQKVRFSVEGLHCKTCAEHLTRVATLIRGVRRAAVDLERRRFESVFDDDHISRERIGREITSLGYRVNPI